MFARVAHLVRAPPPLQPRCIQAEDHRGDARCRARAHFAAVEIVAAKRYGGGRILLRVEGDDAVAARATVVTRLDLGRLHVVLGEDLPVRAERARTRPAQWRQSGTTRPYPSPGPCRCHLAARWPSARSSGRGQRHSWRRALAARSSTGRGGPAARTRGRPARARRPRRSAAAPRAASCPWRPRRAGPGSARRSAAGTRRASLHPSAILFVCLFWFDSLCHAWEARRR